MVNWWARRPAWPVNWWARPPAWPLLAQSTAVPGQPARPPPLDVDRKPFLETLRHFPRGGPTRAPMLPGGSHGSNAGRGNFMLLPRADPASGSGGPGRPDQAAYVRQHHLPAEPHVQRGAFAAGARCRRLRAAGVLRHRQRADDGDGRGLQRRRAPGPGRGQPERRHGVGAPEHDAGGFPSADVRSPEDVRRGGPPVLDQMPGRTARRSRTSTATAAGPRRTRLHRGHGRVRQGHRHRSGGWDKSASPFLLPDCDN